MKRWPSETKDIARKMRLNGASFSEITGKTGVVKSTLSLWLKELPKPHNLYYTNQKEWLHKIQKLAAVANRAKRNRRIQEMTEKVVHDVNSWKTLSQRPTQIAILASLYWAEGGKGRQVVQFANTDPKLALLFITLFRKIYAVDETKFRVRLHLHYYHNEQKVKSFWSELLNIPKSQFNKTYRKYRSREKTYRRNFGGICFIKYNSVLLQEQIMQYAYAFAEKYTGKINVPVA